MSSMEAMILEIEKDYHDIIKSLERNVDSSDGYRGFKEISEDELLRLLRKVIKFQRKIESFLESTSAFSKRTGYGERLKVIADKLLNRLSSEDEIDSAKFLMSESGYYTEEREVIGVIPELKLSHKNFLHNRMTDSRRGCYCAYFGFKSLRSNLIEMEEELRLIGALTTYPIDKKLRLKDRLVSESFEEVVISLEEARNECRG